MSDVCLWDVSVVMNCTQQNVILLIVCSSNTLDSHALCTCCESFQFTEEREDLESFFGFGFFLY